MNKTTTTPIANAVSELGSSSSSAMFLSDQLEAYLDVVEMELDGRVQRLVDLRSLHAKLGVKRDFTDWVKSALINSKSIEGVDFSHLVREVRRERGATQRHDYYASFEVTKIIAARSNADQSIDICRWLVRVEEQVRINEQERLANRTEIDVARDYLKLAQKYVIALEEKEALIAEKAANFQVPRPHVEPALEGISIRGIKSQIAPYLSEKVIVQVLKFFGQVRTPVQYGAHENAVKLPFAREGVEEMIQRFIEEALPQSRISFSRKSVVLKHDCLLGDEAQVSREDAIEYLGYTEEDFVD